MKTLDDVINEVFNQRIEFIRNNKEMNYIKAGGDIYSLILSFGIHYNEYDHKHQKHRFMGIPLEFDYKLGANELKIV